MACPDVSKLMMWIDGELDPSEVAAFTDHVENCSNCSAFVKAQKQMETVWRDSWTDPDDSQFFKMRTGIHLKAQWWKTQRTWFIAAAICAAYLGVKIFFIDGAGTSLTEIAVEESGITTIQVNTEPISVLSPETAPEETVSVENEEIEEEVDVSILQWDSQEESMEDDSEVLEEQFFQSGYEVSEGVGSASGEDHGYGYAEITLSADDLVSGQDSRDDDNANQVGDLSQPFSEDTEEMDTLYRSVASGTTAQPGSLGTSGIMGGFACGGSVGGGTGGGGLPSASADLASTRDITNVDQEQYEASDSPPSFGPAPIEECLITVSASSEISESYNIHIVPEAKAGTSIQRTDWQSLFELIDSLYRENCYLAGEELILEVDIEGNVSGSNVPAGTVIDLPEAGYGNSLIFIQFE